MFLCFQFRLLITLNELSIIIVSGGIKHFHSSCPQRQLILMLWSNETNIIMHKLKM